MMIGPLCKDYNKTLELLKHIKELGFDAIELNGYMIHKTPLLVRLLTKLAGMPSGNSGKLDWHKLIKESGLEVASLHTDLGSLERDLESVANEAKSFNTKYLVITGMYRFDYTNKEQLSLLCERLNNVGEKVKKLGLSLLYHNHNVEFRRFSSGEFVYDYILDNVNPEYVNFEFDSYWASEAGVDIYSLLSKIGSRNKLHHINDRGNRKDGPFITPILESDSMELGTGTLNLAKLIELDKENKTEYVVLETHKNYIDGSRVKSMEISVKYLNENV